MNEPVAKPKVSKRRAAGSAEKWAKAYYQKCHATEPEESLRVLRQILLPRTIDGVGLPDYIPQPILDASSDPPVFANRAEVMASLERATEDGYGTATLSAIHLSLLFSPDEGLPHWVRASFSQSFNAWTSFVARDLEEAFNARRPRTKAKDAAFHKAHSAQMFLDWQQARASGLTSDEEIHEVIGRQFGVSASTAKRMIASVSRQASKQRSQNVRFVT